MRNCGIRLHASGACLDQREFKGQDMRGIRTWWGWSLAWGCLWYGLYMGWSLSDKGRGLGSVWMGSSMSGTTSRKRLTVCSTGSEGDRESGADREPSQFASSE